MQDQDHGKKQADAVGSRRMRMQARGQKGRGWVEVAVVRQTLRRLRDSRGAKSRARDGGWDGQAGQGKVKERSGYTKTRRLG